MSAAVPTSEPLSTAPFTLAGKLLALAEELPPELVTPVALRAMASYVDGLPAAMTRWLVLELPLAEHEAGAADLAFAVVPSEDRGRDILAGCAPGLDLAPRLAERPAWQALRRFAALWRERGSPVWSAVNSLWLELDTAQCCTSARSAPPTSSASPPLDPSIFIGARLERLHSSEPVTVEPFDAAMPVLVGAAAWTTPRPTLVRVLEALPAGLFGLQVGAMLPRGVDTLRLCLAGLAPAEAAQWMSAIGWPGDRSALDDTLQCFGPNVPEVVVQLDIGGAVGERLGVELAAADHGLAWESVLQELTARGLCHPARRDACLRYSAVRLLSLPDGLRTFRWAVRALSHVKVTLVGGGARPTAKVYASLVQR